ncbi:hypothetical protein TNCV_4397191 [Trichonephila clavipes]|nr:hypothetical protein TNCV_4397191 [Trichonephila clavipes]
MPRNFEPRLREEDDTQADTLTQNYPIMPTRGFPAFTDLTCTSGSLVVAVCCLSWNTYEILVEELKYNTNRRIYTFITDDNPACNKKGCAAFHSRRETITGESPTSFLWPRKPSGQGIGSWLACHEFELSTTKDLPCRGAMHVKSVESSNVFPLVW